MNDADAFYDFHTLPGGRTKFNYQTLSVRMGRGLGPGLEHLACKLRM